ncbi:MAG: 50S ribosomal protein L2 [Candidatus Pacebacteria bacterium]|nr:50S ribosomal protein L2 [Candidatus Paceibacterota bacterium]
MQRKTLKLKNLLILSKKKPEKNLLARVKRSGGRGSNGRITSRHIGGGARKLYRIVDFAQTKMNVWGTIAALEYDPNRNAFLMLVEFEDKEKKYMIAPEGVKAGDRIIVAEKAEANAGSRMRLKNIPEGTIVYNIELEPGRGGKIVRSAGTGAVIQNHEGKYSNIKMPSTEIRKILGECFASVGTVSNSEYRFINWSKAGKSRKKGIRPHVRGSAMNPCDHPHGGGECRSPIGMKYPKTPWGKHALGVKTRNKTKWTTGLIIQRRNKKKK